MDKNKVLTAYLLLIFFGGLGAHRIYMGFNKTATMQLLCFMSVFVYPIHTNLIFLFVVWLIWCFFDLFFIWHHYKKESLTSLNDKVTNQSN